MSESICIKYVDRRKAIIPNTIQISCPIKHPLHIDFQLKNLKYKHGYNRYVQKSLACNEIQFTNCFEKKEPGSNRY